jgi:5'-nucleotidase
MVREANFGVRTGAGEFVSMLQQMGVPMLVVSAGITQVVEEVLKSFGLWRTSGMEIASNTMTFDAGGKLVGFANADSIIHPESKCSVWKWKRVSYFGRDDMSKRRNLVVIGDSVSDCDVVLGSEKDVDTVLKIGFYNHDGRSRYPQPYDGYASAFDVVITDDGSFTFVQDLFEDIQRS